MILDMIRMHIWRWRYEHAMGVALKMMKKMYSKVPFDERVDDWRKYMRIEEEEEDE